MTALVLDNERHLDQYVAEIRKFPLLTREEEVELARRHRDSGDVAAAHKLVVSNLRFVVKIAHEYRGYGLKLLDLIQEGNVGLMNAVKKFDPERGYRLISYAVWWIRAHIHGYIVRSWSLVRLGATATQRKLFFKLRSVRSRLQAMLGQEQVPAELLAGELGVPQAEVSEMEKRLAARDFSLDATMDEEKSTAYVDVLPAHEPNQEEIVMRQEQRAMVRSRLDALMPTLDERERYIAEKRLLEDDPVTLQDVGDRFQLTRERARQIEGKLIDKLRKALAEPRPPAALPANGA